MPAMNRGLFLFLAEMKLISKSGLVSSDKMCINFLPFPSVIRKKKKKRKKIIQLKSSTLPIREQT